MPLQTAEAFDAPFTQADIPATASAVRGATFDQALNDLPLMSAVRAVDLSFARSITAADKYSPAEADYYMEERGLKGQFKFDREFNVLELQTLASRKRAELARDEVLSRSEGSGSSSAGRLGITLASQLLDPLAVGSAFVPVVGEARYGALLARAGSALGRAGVRAGVGAIEGVAGAALTEPIIAGAKIQEQADYHFADSFMNVTIGGLFGGGLHMFGGLAGDLLRGRGPRSSQILEEARRVVPDEAPAERAPDVGALSGPLDVPDRYIELARELRSSMARARDVNVSDPAAVSRVAGRQVQSISQFVKDTGGIADEGGELSARDVTSKSMPGLVRKVGTENADMDSVRERLFDAGYFPGKADYNQISDSEIYDAISNDLAGDRTYPVDAHDMIARLNDERGFMDRLESQGITRDMELSDIAGRLREIDDESRTAEPKDSGTADLFEEYEGVRARELVESADGPTAEAAMRAGVAQAVSGDALDVRPVFDRSSLRDAARRIADPDQRPLTDPRSIDIADEKIAAGDPNELATVREEVANLQARLASQLEEEALDAPNFGLEAPPRTLADNDPLLAPRDTDNSPERVAMRERIVAKELKGAQSVVGRKPVAYLMGGGGASGKGTILKRLIEDGNVPEHGVVHVDPDEIKKQIPEFSEIVKRGDSRAAAVVHEESSAIAKQVIDGAMKKRADMVLDRTLSKPDKGVAEINALKAAGYEVKLFGVTVDPVNAIARADKRARGSGRYVPPNALLAAHKGFAHGFEDLARAADEAILFDNEVPQGQAPKILAVRGSGKSMKVKDERGYNAFRERSKINEAATTAREVVATREVDRGNGPGDRELDAGANARGDGGQGQGSREAAAHGGIPAERLATLPAEIRAELEAADLAVSQAQDATQAARLMVACALRGAA